MSNELFCEESRIRYKCTDCGSPVEGFIYPEFRLYKRAEFFSLKGADNKVLTLEFSNLPSLDGVQYEEIEAFEAALTICVDNINLQKEVLEFENTAAFPTIGKSEVIYISEETNLLYKWDSTGESYVLVGDGTGVGGTDLAVNNRTATALDVTSSTGSPATIPEATTSLSGLLIASDKTKLNNTTGVNSGDEVFNFANLAAFPVTGAQSSIYIADDTNLIYKWDGAQYVLLRADAVIWEQEINAQLLSTIFHNNWNPSGFTNADVIYITTDNANRQITGMQAPVAGEKIVKILVNNNTNNWSLRILNQSGLSLPANRFFIRQNVTLQSRGEAAIFRYSFTYSAWYLIGEFR